MGTPAELYNNPQNIFVAGFIGAPPMNMLEGRLEERNGNLIIDLKFCIYELSKKARELMKKTTLSEVILGIRPENIMIMKESKKNSFKATVIHIELIGKEFNIYLKAGESDLIAIRSSIKDLRIGDKVWLYFDEKNIHIFDQKSGKVLL
jgi:multiple sugar transport system ATP-binding protein